MKLIIASFLLVAQFAYATAELDLAEGAIAQAAPVEPIVQSDPAEAAKDIQGTIAEPTHEQKKHVNEAIKKAKKKKKDKKLKPKVKEKTHPKAKNKAKIKSKQKAAKKTSDT